ncbi:MAG: UDP-3-O-(3-hydroxymyristoyl)glucosamine N-acyltransferase [Acidobacteria bacterium]|nr:MAG: UDP-3-O-(3-hydroxymyristoyl)glucosamine N-acyltransferase [Acidobacteriota bacterium]
MYKLQQLAQLVGGRIHGDSALEIEAVRPLEAAQPGDLTLAEGRKNRERLESCPASAVIVPPGVTFPTKTLLEVARPKLAFAQILEYVHRTPFRAQGISPLSAVGKDCRIPPEVSIYPFASLGERVTIGLRVTVFSGVRIGDGCAIGDDVVLHPNVVLYPGVRLGNRVVIHGGTVIGADGFGYVFDGSRQVKIPQTGTVVIDDDVEIGANSCVDRGTFGPTVIEKGVKLDNHVHIAHNCRVGSNTIMVAQVGISGSVSIGRNCIFAGHSGVVDHVTIGDDVKVMMKSGVSKDVPPKSSVSGQPAMDHRQAMRIESITRRLPEIYEEWKQLKKRMKEGGS